MFINLKLYRWWAQGKGLEQGRNLLELEELELGERMLIRLHLRDRLLEEQRFQ